jgi:hypothetical protein
VNDVAASRARLADISRELASLQAQHDLAMSAFRFDEANALQHRIEAMEDKRRAVAAALPLGEPATVSPSGIVPMLARPRRLRRTRR